MARSSCEARTSRKGTSTPRTRSRRSRTDGFTPATLAKWRQPGWPRSGGSGTLKRTAGRNGAGPGGRPPRPKQPGSDVLAALVAKHAGRADLSAATTFDELGLSSLDRVELMVALEDAFQTRIDEGSFSAARDLGALRSLVEHAATGETAPAEPVEFPTWTRGRLARAFRRINLPLWV